MYDRAELQPANDALWSLVREHLGFGPETLDREIGLWEGWEHPDLVLGQTCNLPYRTRLHGKVHVVGHPDFDLPHCPPGTYNSVLIARQDDPRSLEELLRARVVINQDHSQSGHLSLWDHADPLGIKPNITAESGGHVASVRMIADGDGDIAAIDAHTWRVIRRYDPHSSTLREIVRTRPTPATPYICSLSHDPVRIREALAHAIAALPLVHRIALNLKGVVQRPVSEMMALPHPPHLMATA
ncbi:phosphate/phosphite/phosphonate ABC transporter substrate-binding protein [Tropicibacter sp. S64]|uniref:phosphate/phosphite/phosphonate ABC transporter substrate-binding protein n=1 Tax=Tropicibacter sp. S64 TaxID=3415122 RepID=UPI003C7AA097